MRVLEDEVEELEEERARLRRRLRENALGGEGDLQEAEDEPNSRKKLRDELLELQERCRHYEEQVQMLQERQPQLGGMVGNQSMLQGEQFEELKNQNRELKEYVANLFSKMAVQNSGDTGEGAAAGGRVVALGDPTLPYKILGVPPTPLPGAFGNYNDIKDGYSQRFGVKLPVDLSGVQGDSGVD